MFLCRSVQVTREKRDPRLQLASGGAAQLAEEVAQDWNGYESIPINTMFRGMNIHLPAIFIFIDQILAERSNGTQMGVSENG